MAEDFYVEKSDNSENNEVDNNGNRVIDEANYRIHAPQQYGPSAIGKGGDPLFKNIRATKAQLENLLQETTTVQDWIQRETCNNVALACLNNGNLKDVYYQIKDGFGEYGPILLMGFKTPQGVEIPRLKILGKDGTVKEVLTGPMVIDELNRRAEAFQLFQSSENLVDELPIENTYEVLDNYVEEQNEESEVYTELQDYNS